MQQQFKNYEYIIIYNLVILTYTPWVVLLPIKWKDTCAAFSHCDLKCALWAGESKPLFKV